MTGGSRLPLLVVQYAISGNTRRTEHWALAAVTDIDQSSARIFHMKGNTDTFALDVLDVPNITKSRSYRGGFQVGEISGSRLHDLELWVTQIPVHRNNPKWDCQTWVIEMLREMHMDGRAVVFDGVSESGIRKALGEEMANDEVGDELVDERLKN